MKSIKLKLTLLMLLIAIISGSCSKGSDCDQDCFTPPGPITFRVLNDSVDLIYNGYYDSDSISLYYIDNEIIVNMEISIFRDTVLEISKIHTNEIGWISLEGNHDFYLRLNSNEIESIYLLVVSTTIDCCTFHPIRDIEINGNQPYFDDASYSFIIQKELN